MILREILQKIVEKQAPILLSDSSGDWEANDLLENLTESKLKRSAHLQQGLYIAEINDGGYLGQVLYKLKPRG